VFAACVSMLTWFWAVPGLMSRSTFVALAVFLLGGTAVLLMAWRDVQAAGSTASSQATNFKVKVTVDNEIPDVRPGFTCTAELTTATRQKAIAIPIQATTVREMIVDREGNIVRDESKGPQRGGRGSVQAAELKPGQERKELEGVFVVRDNKALFTPVKTGIAGEKYFEALSGVKEGDQVIVGPFSSVRELRDGTAVKIETASRSTAPGAK